MGARISETIAKTTYRAFERHGLVTPETVLDAGRESDPDPHPVVREMAERYGVDRSRYDRESEMVARVEAGLVRKRHEE